MSTNWAYSAAAAAMSHHYHQNNHHHHHHHPLPAHMGSASMPPPPAHAAVTQHQHVLRLPPPTRPPLLQDALRLRPMALGKFSLRGPSPHPQRPEEYSQVAHPLHQPHISANPASMQTSHHPHHPHGHAHAHHSHHHHHHHAPNSHLGPNAGVQQHPQTAGTTSGPPPVPPLGPTGAPVPRNNITLASMAHPPNAAINAALASGPGPPTGPSGPQPHLNPASLPNSAPPPAPSATPVSASSSSSSNSGTPAGDGGAAVTAVPPQPTAPQHHGSNPQLAMPQSAHQRTSQPMPHLHPHHPPPVTIAPSSSASVMSTVSSMQQQQQQQQQPQQQPPQQSQPPGLGLVPSQHLAQAPPAQHAAIMLPPRLVGHQNQGVRQPHVSMQQYPEYMPQSLRQHHQPFSNHPSSGNGSNHQQQNAPSTGGPQQPPQGSAGSNPINYVTTPFGVALPQTGQIPHPHGIWNGNMVTVFPPFPGPRHHYQAGHSVSYAPNPPASLTTAVPQPLGSAAGGGGAGGNVPPGPPGPQGQHPQGQHPQGQHPQAMQHHLPVSQQAGPQNGALPGGIQAIHFATASHAAPTATATARPPSGPLSAAATPTAAPGQHGMGLGPTPPHGVHVPGAAAPGAGPGVTPGVSGPGQPHLVQPGPAVHYQTPTGQPQNVRQNRRQSGAIKIVDPISGKDVTDDILNTGHLSSAATTTTTTTPTTTTATSESANRSHTVASGSAQSSPPPREGSTPPVESTSPKTTPTTSMQPTTPETTITTTTTSEMEDSDESAEAPAVEPTASESAVDGAPLTAPEEPTGKLEEEEEEEVFVDSRSEDKAETTKGISVESTPEPVAPLIVERKIDEIEATESATVAHAARDPPVPVSPPTEFGAPPPPPLSLPTPLPTPLSLSTPLPPRHFPAPPPSTSLSHAPPTAPLTEPVPPLVPPIARPPAAISRIPGTPPVLAPAQPTPEPRIMTDETTPDPGVLDETPAPSLEEISAEQLLNAKRSQYEAEVDGAAVRGPTTLSEDTPVAGSTAACLSPAALLEKALQPRLPAEIPADERRKKPEHDVKETVTLNGGIAPPVIAPYAPAAPAAAPAPKKSPSPTTFLPLPLATDLPPQSPKIMPLLPDPEPRSDSKAAAAAASAAAAAAASSATPGSSSSSKPSSAGAASSAAEKALPYKDNQWRPGNPEGKKTYDREFLLSLMTNPLSMSKPEKLPQISDVVLDKPRQFLAKDSTIPSLTSTLGAPSAGAFDLFVPGYVKPTPSRPIGSSHGSQRGVGGGGGRNEPRGPQGSVGGKQASIKKVISIGRSLSEDVKLQKAENAWQPSIKKSKNMDPETEKTEKIFKQVRGILNKLTPQKFATLVNQILNLQIDTQDRLKGVIDIIFEKAIDEPGFSVAYANMCKHLMLIRVPAPDEKKESKKTEDVYFRKLLLNRCQREFETGTLIETDFENKRRELEKIADPEEKARQDEELAEKEAKAKRRYLGNIRFIGELFKLKMLTENIMHDCIIKLLKKKDDEESLECLCRLMTTIGKDLDSDQKSAKQRMDSYFAQFDKIVKSRKTTSRVRFMIQDVIDLRKRNWIPRRDENAPKTIDQIHKEVQKEEEEMLARLAENKIKERERRARGGTPGRPGEQDGWQTVPPSVNKMRQLDLSKFKLTKPTMDENSIQLGPGGRAGSWIRGSSGGGAKPDQQQQHMPPHLQQQPQQQGDRSSPGDSPANRFTALSSGTAGGAFDGAAGSSSGAASSTEPRLGPNRLNSSSNSSRSLPLRGPSAPTPGGGYARGSGGSGGAGLSHLMGASGANAMPPHGKRGSNPREEARRERDSALAAAREFTTGGFHYANAPPAMTSSASYGGGGGGRQGSRPNSQSSSRPNSRPASREGSRSREFPDRNADRNADRSGAHGAPFARDFGVKGDAAHSHHPAALSASVPSRPLTVATSAPTTPATTPTTSTPPLTEQKVEQRTRDLVDEFLHGADMKEALLCVRELNSPALMHVVVSSAFNQVLERSEAAREQTGSLLHDLLKERIITCEDFKTGVHSILEFAEDLVIDIPQIWTYLGQIVGPLVDVSNNALPFSHFKEIAAPLVKIQCADKFIASVLATAKKRIGAKNVAEVWEKSGLAWSHFCGDDDRNLKDLVAKHGLEFTTSAQSNSPISANAMSMDQVQKHLEKMMKDSKDDEIDKWIQGIVDKDSQKLEEFIRALMTAVVSSAISGESTNTHYDGEVIKRHVKLLHKYLDRSVVLELQALYALQGLIHSLQHPPGLLQQIFDTLYDEDIVSEEAFNMWHNSEDPNETVGKGVALKSVVQFFTWLREADEEDDEEDESNQE